MKEEWKEKSNMEEIWKDIPGYEGYYQVSNIGRVKSLERIVHYKPGSKSANPHKSHIVRERILTQRVADTGYYVVTLSKGAKRKIALVHRLIACSFITNKDPAAMRDINHKDGCRTNNDIDNLEWCTRSYNVNYGNRNDTVARKNTNHPAKSTPVFSIDMDGNFSFYDSIGEAERQTGIAHGNIVRTLKGHTPRCGKRYWFYSITTPTHLANND